jgi:branched-chain amino acid transport system permease protein
MAAVGGLATVWGAPFGAAVITLLTEVLRSIVPKLLDHASGEYEIIAFGILLILVMIFMPQGVVQGVTDIYNRQLTRKPTATPIGGKSSLLPPVLRRWFRLGS